MIKPDILALLSLAALTSPIFAAVTYVEYNGHGYAIDDVGTSWSTANSNASSLTNPSNPGWGSPHLVVIDSQAENDEMLSLLQALGIGTTASDGGGGTYAWLGATEPSEGTYQWNDGTIFWSGGTTGSAQNGQFANWGSYQVDFGGGPTSVNEPDNFQGTQNRAAISTTGWPIGNPFVVSPASAGQWNDVNDTNNLAYIVEFDQIPEPSSLVLLLVGAGAFLRRKRR